MKLLLITLSILAITTTTSNLTNFILNMSLQRVQLLDDKTQQNTIYIDKVGKQVSTSEVDLSNINSKEVIQIGFFQNWEKEVQVVKMPRTIEKVPDQLPSEITTLKNMFMDARSFNQDISKWNTSNVVDMSYMFAGASSFNQNLSWNTSNVTNMSYMFAGASSFNQGISNWDVVNVITMHAMFAGASSFNQNLSWNIIKVKDMSAMFAGASLFIGNITNLIYDNNVTNMNDMFRNCSSFNQDIGKWDTSKVTDMGYMFYKASLFNQNLSGWNVNEVLWHGWFAKNLGFENDPNKWPKFKN